MKGTSGNRRRGPEQYDGARAREPGTVVDQELVQLTTSVSLVPEWFGSMSLKVPGLVGAVSPPVESVLMVPLEILSLESTNSCATESELTI